MAARKKVARLPKKNKRGAWKLIIKLTGFLLLAGILFTGADMAAKSSLFELREVVFIGNKYLGEREMMGLMGIERGESLFMLPQKEVAGMLGASQWVKSVIIRKEYPHRLVVKIVEAVPAALLNQRGEVFFVDTEGSVLERLNSSAVPFLPVIVSGAARNPQSFMAAVALAQIITQKGLMAKNKRIEISGVEKSPENLHLQLDGLTVRVGQGGYEEKLRRLFELSDEIKRRRIKVKYVDLRFSNSVVVKPVNEALN